LQRVHAYGLLAIVLGFIALAIWSSLLARRFALTLDYSFYGQAWYLIAHGHLNPYSTTFPPSFWHNAFELVIWPLAPLWYLWPHTVTLLWVQDAATAGCEATLFIWMCEVTAKKMASGRLNAWGAIIPACGGVVLLATPWTIWIDSFDFHPQSIDLLITLLAARAFWKGRVRRGWIYSLIALLCGSIGATYIAGLGISAVLAGRRWRRVGLVLIAGGLVWLLVLSRIGADHASGVYTDLAKGSRLKKLSTITVLKLIAEHPGRALSAMWKVRTDVYADVASGGFVGFFTPWTFGITSLVLLEGALTGDAGFIQPSVQNSLPAILLVPFGTVVVVLAMASARRRVIRGLAVALAALAVANGVGWSIVWTHRVAKQWLSVPPASAAVLQRTLAKIPSTDEVIASQGIMGSFSFRTWIYPLVTGPAANFAVHSHTVWFVITPSVGIETETWIAAEAQVRQLVSEPGVQMVTDDDNVYVFKVHPTRGQTSISFANNPSVPAWVFADHDPVETPRASVAQWHAFSETAGDVVSGDAWSLPNGPYEATARFSSNGPVDIQLWDDSDFKMIASRTFPSTGGTVRTAHFDGAIIDKQPAKAYAGSRIFRVDPVEPGPGDSVELRVINPGDTTVSVFSVGLSHT
jgi:hypothetical protein